MYNVQELLKAEFNDIKNNKPPGLGIDIGLIDDDYFHWRATLSGPEDTPYNGGAFFLEINFSENYPIDPPVIKFITPIYHINVQHLSKFGDLGRICMSTLDKGSGCHIKKLLQQCYALFYIGNPESPYGLDRMNEFNSNRSLWDEKARYFTKKYATYNQDESFKYDNWDFTYDPNNNNNNTNNNSN